MDAENQQTEPGVTPLLEGFAKSETGARLNVQARLREAARSLLDLSLKNKMVKFRASKRIHLPVHALHLGAVVDALMAEEDRPIPLEAVEELEGGGADWGSDGEASLAFTTQDEDPDRRSRNLANEARVFEQEHGYGALFLAVGFLEWKETDGTEPIESPLLLYPVQLTRTERRGYRVTPAGEEPALNPALLLKLEQDYGVQLAPPATWDSEGLRQLVHDAESIASEKGWRVLPKLVLGMFKFHKFVMYKDVQALLGVAEEENLPGAVEAVLDPQPEDPALDRTPVMDEQDIEERIQWSKVHYVRDADPSQIAAIETVKAGRHLVIQGPPGTGKSETITNLIAELIGEGKKVLFVSEKEAALDVVRRRLEQSGLGDFCLALHGVKTSYEAFRAQMTPVFEGSFRLPPATAHNPDALERSRKQLQSYAAALREAPPGTDLTLGWALGESVLLANGASPPPRLGSKPGALPKKTDLLDVKALAQERIQWHTAWGRANAQPWAWLRQADPDLAVRLQESYASAASALSAHQGACRDLEAIGVEPPANAATVKRMEQWLADLAQARPVDGIESAADLDQMEAFARQASATVKDLVAARDRLQKAGIQWQTEASAAELREKLASLATGFLFWMRPSYWKAKGDATTLYTTKPKGRKQILEDLGELAHLQNARASSGDLRLKAAHIVHVQDTEWDALMAAVETLSLWLTRIVADLRLHGTPEPVAVAIAHPERAEAHAASIKAAVATWKALEQETASLQGLLPKGSKPPFAAEQPTAFIQAFVPWYGENQATIGPWLSHLDWRSRAASSWLPGLTDTEPADTDGPALLQRVHTTVAGAIIDASIRRRPELAAFTQDAHEQERARFQAEDSSLKNAARRSTAERLIQRASAALDGGYEGTPMFILRRELKKKRRRLPIRRLVEQTLPILQELKPCFMMSPITVATYLSTKATLFDVLIFDEASQVRPEDALVCLMRARQVVVVGDSKQLPPSSFFDAIDAEEAEADADSMADVESILDQCVIKGFPERSLRWHYRSRHHSLIEGSNQEFYGGRLLVFHSPSTDVAKLGMRHHYFPASTYAEGGDAVNRKEAQEIARLVRQHFHETPEKTLGVAAFSVPQRDEIRDQLYALAETDPQLQEWIDADGDEPFFVKNLENVQGDERDHIIISVGYGRDAERRIRRNFGPVNKQGGERRLNVLFSRARERCTVVSNFLPDQLDVSDIKSRGPQALKRFLQLAHAGAWPQTAETGQEMDSPFERAVKEFLESQQFRIVPQVGCAGYRIDLAVIDPHQDGRYCLAIECDGATYHSSRVARERDRQREEVLRRLGWTVVRVWSTEWFYRPGLARERLLAAVRAAAAPQAPRPTAAPRLEAAVTTPPAKETILVTAQLDMPRLELAPYIPCALPPGSLAAGVGETSPRILAPLVEQVVQEEAPLHVDVLVQRLREAAGQQRAGGRARQAVLDALDQCARRGKAKLGKDDIVRNPTAGPIEPRRRDNTWKAEHLPAEEVEAAMLQIITQGKRVPEETVLLATRDAFGFGRLGKDLRDTMRAALDRLIEKEDAMLSERSMVPK
ncbi:MAG TPA: DUF3320 domain-containing protein [Candidatus Thermoplasmatota archaeon]|nr:DUF3320 domain-containing protein [Candidatus Thermoplasmatota archaeon]